MHMHKYAHAEFFDILCVYENMKISEIQIFITYRFS